MQRRRADGHGPPRPRLRPPGGRRRAARGTSRARRRTGLPVGGLSTNVTVYAPVGAPLQALGLDDGFVSGTTATVAGRDVQVVTSRLAPGRARRRTGSTVPVRDGVVSVWTTPTLTSPGSSPPPAEANG